MTICREMTKSKLSGQMVQAFLFLQQDQKVLAAVARGRFSESKVSDENMKVTN